MAKLLQVVSTSPEDTQQIGEQIGRWLQNPVCICLFGDLGVGKTTFLQGLARGLGVKKAQVKSPTYVYLTEYPLKKHPSGAKKLLHMDCYRLDCTEPPFDLLEPLEQSNDFIAIEWAERIAEHLPPDRIDIRIAFRSENERSIGINRTVYDRSRGRSAA